MRLLVTLMLVLAVPAGLRPAIAQGPPYTQLRFNPLGEFHIDMFVPLRRGYYDGRIPPRHLGRGVLHRLDKDERVDAPPDLVEPLDPHLLELKLGDVHLIPVDALGYPKQCRRVSEVLPKVTDTNSYYIVMFLARICESIVIGGGIFDVKFYGSFPFTELEDGKRYRATFFSRLRDLSISRANGMNIASERVYIEVILNVNIIHSEDIDKRKEMMSNPQVGPIASFSCRGSWRNFFSAPESLEGLFIGGEERFSIVQDDECESTIKNLLKDQPSLLTDVQK